MTAMADATPGSRLEDRDWAAWFIRNRRNLTVTAVAVVVVGLGYWILRSQAARNEVAAGLALEQARSAAEAGNLPLAANDLVRIVERFKRTRAGAQAAILLAQVRLSQGQAEPAVTGLETFLRSGHQDYVAASAYNLLGVGLETLGRFQEAAAAFREASDRAELDFLKAAYLIDASRVLALAGDTAAARQALSQVIERYGELAQSAEARVRLGELGGGTATESPSRPPEN
jgi:tetratricopeptide (TPR) repeat protein